MSMLKKKADTGAYEPGAFGEVGPMNEHNDFKWYNESIWNRDTGYKGPYPAAGTEGDPTSHAPRNEMIFNPGHGQTPMDELDEHKLNVIPEGNVAVFDVGDLEDLNDHMTKNPPMLNTGFRFSANLQTQAYIRKVPGKNEWNVYSESGKSLGKGYKSEKAAKERLKQVEMFKHMDKKANNINDVMEDPDLLTGYDFKGQGAPTGHVIEINTGNIAPQENTTPESGMSNKSPVFGVNYPAQQVSPENVPGMNQNDSALATDNEEFEAHASVTPSVKGKGVTPSVVNPVSNDLKGGSTGFSGTRGTRGTRGTKSTRAELAGFVFTKNAASRVDTMVDTFTGSERRNDQSPWANEGTNLSSYNREEMAKIKQTPEFKYSGPLNTAIPSTFEERLYATDTTNMAGGTEFGTWDFFITPTNQSLDKDENPLEKQDKEKDTKQNN